MLCSTTLTSPVRNRCRQDEPGAESVSLEFSPPRSLGRGWCARSQRRLMRFAVVPTTVDTFCSCCCGSRARPPARAVYSARAPGLTVFSGPASVIRAANLGGVFREREPVQPRGVGVAEQQIEQPSPTGVEPVVGQLLAADFVVDEPCPARARGGVLDQ